MPFSNLYLYRYKVTIQPIDTLFLPPYKGSAFRGVFGRVLKNLACLYNPKKNCNTCQFSQKCAYGYIFETYLSKDEPDFRKHKNAPHPYIIVPPLTQTQYFTKDEKLSFYFTLIGKANDYLPYIIYSFLEMGKRGIGKGRKKFKVISVDACFGKYACKEIYDPKKDHLKKINNCIRYNDFLKKSLPINEISLVFETPVRIKRSGNLISPFIPFITLIERLCERATLLTYYHCGGKNKEYQTFLKGAEKIKVKESSLYWYDWERYSAKQGRMKLGGLIGKITYEGNLKKFLPLLHIGEFIHVGKATTFGLGKYSLYYEHSTL